MNAIDFSSSIKCEDKIKLITNYFDEIMVLYGIMYQYQYNELSIDSYNTDYVSFRIKCTNDIDTIKLFNIININQTKHIYDNTFNVLATYIDTTSLLIGFNKLNKDTLN